MSAARLTAFCPTTGLTRNARAIRYEVTIDSSVDGEFTYSETTVFHHAGAPEQVVHTDRNTLKRIADA
jgi:hypothetical protein